MNFIHDFMDVIDVSVSKIATPHFNGQSMQQLNRSLFFLLAFLYWEPSLEKAVCQLSAQKLHKKEYFFNKTLVCERSPSSTWMVPIYLMSKYALVIGIINISMPFNISNIRKNQINWKQKQYGNVICSNYMKFFLKVYSHH